MVSRKSLSEQEFLACVRQYWSNYAVAREADGEGNSGRHFTPGSLSENAFYRMDTEATDAIRHAVEDLALEEANGSLLSTFACGRSFEDQRERYTHLAATIDQVEIVVPPPLPRRVPHARFIRDGRRSCCPYRLTLYEGKRHRALMVGRQINQTAVVEDRQFDGFYSFNSRLIARIRRDMIDLAAGQLPILREFHRLCLIDQVGKQIKTEFAREEEALDAAMQRLLLDGERYQASQFAFDLERGLSRLGRWKNRLPEILARADV